MDDIFKIIPDEIEKFEDTAGRSFEAMLYRIEAQIEDAKKKVETNNSIPPYRKRTESAWHEKLHALVKQVITANTLHQRVIKMIHEERIRQMTIKHEEEKEQLHKRNEQTNEHAVFLQKLIDDKQKNCKCNNNNCFKAKTNVG